MATQYAIEFKNPATGQWVRLDGFTFATATAAILFRLECLSNIAAEWHWIAI